MIDSLHRSQIILVVLAVLFVLWCAFTLFDRRKTCKLSQKLKRSNDYRAAYFKRHKGLFGKGIFFCPFCGKVMWKKEQIQIDHISSIQRVQNSAFLRERFGRLPGGVNDFRNLVHSCPECNRRKGSKGGVWVFLGHYGIYFMPVLRYTAFGAAIYLVSSAVFFGGWKI